MMKNVVGSKYDGGKLRYDLLSDHAEDEMVAVLTYGAEVYGAYNWKKIDGLTERYTAALRRHLSDWRKGRKFDRDTGLLELAHVACCAQFLLAAEIEADLSLAHSLPGRLAEAVDRARQKRAKAMNIAATLNGPKVRAMMDRGHGKKRASELRTKYGVTSRTKKASKK